MAVRYTEEQLNTVDKSLLIQMFLNQQEQLETLTAEVRSLNEKMQLMMEQMVLANRNRLDVPPKNGRCQPDQLHGSGWNYRLLQ